jgi:predicted aldo/keto reductase-like oxidoreductase
MQYRRFGKLDWNGSILGFGGARFPISAFDPERSRDDCYEYYGQHFSDIENSSNCHCGSRHRAGNRSAAAFG